MLGAGGEAPGWQEAAQQQGALALGPDTWMQIQLHNPVRWNYSPNAHMGK